MHFTLRKNITANLKKPQVQLFLISLAPRLIFYLLMLTQLDAGQMSSYYFDTSQYVKAAEAITERFDFDTYGVYTYGPGYPSILALLGYVISPDPRVLVFIQILMGAVGSVMLYQFSLKLTGDHRISFVAGMINGLSLESIGLANVLLSETFFFTILLTGLLVYWRGMETNRIAYYIAAAFIFASAALIRPAVQFFFIVLLFISLCYTLSGRERTWRSVFVRLRGPLVMSGIIVVVLGSWIGRNASVYQMPYLSMSGPMGMAKLFCMIKADLTGTFYGDVYKGFKENLKLVEGVEGHYQETLSEQARDSLLTVLRQEPTASIGTFLESVWTSVVSEWGAHYNAFPKLKDKLRRITFWFFEKRLNYREVALASIGLIIILMHAKYRIALVLIVIFVYFAFLSGFTIWQGARIFYPGQLAWTILAAYLLVFLYNLYNLLARKIRQHNLI